MERCILEYKSSRISYIRFGIGPKLIFCFHGYGEDATSFSFFEKYTGNQFSFFAIDLPFHGLTEWNEGLTCTIGDITEVMEKILNDYNRKSLTNSKFSLMGYSLGGRVALSLYEKMPSQIERVILLAPDGLKLNFWYWLSTQTRIGSRLFSLTMRHPAWFFGLLKGLNKLNLVNSSIFKFVNYYIGDETVRQLLYKRWISLRKLRPDVKQIKLYIQLNKPEFRLIYGKHDRIILPARGKKLIQQNGVNCSLTIIHSGHQVLQEKHIGEILPALLQ